MEGSPHPAAEKQVAHHKVPTAENGPALPWKLPSWAAPAAAGAGAAAILALSATGNLEQVAALYPGCPFRMLTGLDCPGCGGTRAAAALGRGDLAAALDHNLLTVTLIPLLAAAWWRKLQESLGRGTALHVSAAAGKALLTAIVLFAVARNIPAFSWLASGAA